MLNSRSAALSEYPDHGSSAARRSGFESTFGSASQHRANDGDGDDDDPWDAWNRFEQATFNISAEGTSRIKTHSAEDEKNQGPAANFLAKTAQVASTLNSPSASVSNILGGRFPWSKKKDVIPEIKTRNPPATRREGPSPTDDYTGYGNRPYKRGEA